MRYFIKVLIFILALTSPSHAIVGADSDASAFKSQLVMVLREGGGVCSGVVVSPQVVLTAAHCVGASPSSVRIHFKNDDGSPALVTPKNIVRHPDYRSDAIQTRTRSVDLALVHLSQALPETFVAAKLSDAVPLTGTPLFVAGFGVTVEGAMESIGQLKGAVLKTIMPYGVSTLFIWAQSPDQTSKGACQGDSGGAIYSGDNVVAITSWSTGVQNKKCGKLTQGILLKDQKHWVNTTVAQWGHRVVWVSD